jgi:hypothetical protein
MVVFQEHPVFPACLVRRGAWVCLVFVATKDNRECLDPPDFLDWMDKQDSLGCPARMASLDSPDFLA